MNKPFIFISILILMAILLTGCWNYREIDKLALVSGLAVDKNGLNKGYEVTAEIVSISTSSTKEPNFHSTKIQSKGESIFDCMRNMINVSAKQLFWSHAAILIVSEDVAKESILPVLDWITRDSEPRLTLYVLVSKEKTAKEILNSKSLSTEIRSFEIEDMIISNKRLSKVPNIQVYQLLNDVSTAGIYPVLPTAELVYNGNKETMALSGGAILNNDKLVDYMDFEDVNNYLFIRDQIKGGIINTTLINNGSIDNIALEIFKNKTKINPIISNEEISMNIKITTEVSIAESSASINALNKMDIEKLEIVAEKTLKDNILKTIARAQNDFELDIFGFGNLVKEKMPHVWKDIENNWDEIFKGLKINLDVDINVRGSGHLLRSVKSNN
ncbi:spore germination protein KC [Tissierella praeacuta DSM 18095]|uniref:Spore germination protein KC n=1 Tax=Tissierella praeacuta DSM 18095 TaxID=1123404 RepID=A0A1M4WJM2_9FIRM|nr:Ger(x)C family spore germination protein [Tissierella praeacuta]SHE81449.1 spore germination protein KC [Tissierella praeacuta DSM 18095]SUO99364.1 Spore germination protein B3 precursor [Tissierella praeacuta]